MATTDARGPFRGLRPRGDSFEVTVDTVTVPLADMVRLTFPDRANRWTRPPVVVVLPDSSELWGTIAAGSADEIQVTTPVLGTVRVELTAVRAILVPASFPSMKAFDAFRLAVRSTRAEDAVWTVEGATITGIVERVEPDAVVMAAKTLGEVTFRFSRIYGIALAQLEEPPRAGGLRLGASLTDGSHVVGSPRGAADERLELATAVGPVAIPFTGVEELGVSGGAWTFLSEREPSAADERSFLGDVVWKMRKDANCLGEPLRVRGRRYRRGLGVHSYAKIAYQLGGAYARFEARAALDDAAIDERLDTRFGNVVFSVYVDGQKRFDSGNLSWNDQPRPVSIDVTGAATLELEVAPGIGFHVRDRANWLEARLLRAATSSP